MECFSQFHSVERVGFVGLDDFRWIAKWNRPCHCVPWLSYHLARQFIATYLRRLVTPNGGEFSKGILHRVVALNQVKDL